MKERAESKEWIRLDKNPRFALEPDKNDISFLYRSKLQLQLSWIDKNFYKFRVFNTFRDQTPAIE
ncbi:MAG: hypothetical protein K2G23_11380 [Muribaculaceae bacterium]|nr:hypothetical protein [Muribaculaceae bacterium]